jgi:hypothetical protein
MIRNVTILSCHNPAITDFMNTTAALNMAKVPTTTPGVVRISFDLRCRRDIDTNGKWVPFEYPKRLKGR